MAPVSATFPFTPESIPGAGMAVDIYVFDDTVLENPISGVVVNVYEPETFVQYATATTDADGRAAFTLDGAATPGEEYEVRAFKLGVLFQNPFAIEVLDPLGAGELNRFDLSGTLVTLDVATDPRLCRCTGRFMDQRNLPQANLMVRIMAKGEFQAPKVVDGNMISETAMEFETDSDGRLVVDLLRDGEFYITFAGDDDTVWSIKIPDRSSVNLIDLIHPQPVSFTWDSDDAPGDAISLAAEATEEVALVVRFSDYQDVEEGLSSYITAESSDEDVATVVVSSTGVTVTGVSAGSATISLSVLDTFLPTMIPFPTLTGTDLTVTVT